MSSLASTLEQLEQAAALQPNGCSRGELTSGLILLWHRLPEPDGEVTDVVTIRLASGERVSAQEARRVIDAIPECCRFLGHPVRKGNDVDLKLARVPLCDRCDRPVDANARVYGDGSHCTSCGVAVQREQRQAVVG